MAARGLLVCLLASGSAPRSFAETKHRWKKIWTASVAAVVAVNVLDARSSAGRYETNPLLQNGRGQFSAGRAIAIKSGATGGILLLQVLLRKRTPEQSLEKPSAIVNFAAAAVVGATAYRNTRVAP
jgi:hypothetical protein